MSASESKLNTGPVWRRLLGVSAPMSIGILGVLSVGLADAYFLARVGDAELAAVGFVYPITVALSAFAIGISAGANTALSQAIGAERDAQAVARLAVHALVMGALIGLTLALCFWAISPNLFHLLGARGDTLAAVLNYVPWWAASFPILIMTMVLEATFRASGDGATPATIMVFTAVMNVGLTPVLAFGWGPVPDLGMQGAALATFIARLMAGILSFALATRRGRLATGAHPTKGWTGSVREVTSVGLPASAARGINPAGMAAVTAAVATLGDQAVAGFGAAARVQAIAIVPFAALSAGLAPVIGQAWGASMTDRAQEAVRVAVWFVIAYGFVVGVTLWYFADPIAAVMTAGSTSADYTARYLGIVGLSLGFYGLIVATNAALTARSRARIALLLSGARIGVLYIPLAWAGVNLLQYDGILGAAVITNIGAAAAALYLLWRSDLVAKDLRVVPDPVARTMASGRSPRG